ncbi:MAG TPA: Crp/Fnr family transcriptional regulator [Thermomonas sp.]|jgi:CRP/FNR family cyclic AMP-dependent transcriptional regulator|nr:Crp/Fnr family transcriptional regulator [Thermomonas sp.]
MDEIEHLLPPALLDQLARDGNPLHFGDGEVLFREGDPSDSLHLLLSGQLKVYSRNASGREVVFNVLGPGQIVGELFLDGGTRSASVKAVGDVECLSVDPAAIHTLLRSSPDFAEHLIKLLIARLRAVTRKARSLALDGVYERVVALLEETAVPGRDGLRVPQHLTQLEIASRIGASREMVNHVLRDLVRGGFIVKDGRHRMTIVGKLPRRW